MTGAADPAMTGEENLRLMADLQHSSAATLDVPAWPCLLERSDLVDAARRPASTESARRYLRTMDDSTTKASRCETS
jgi:hypothetical protein